MTASESRRRDWEGRWRSDFDDTDFEGCCGGSPRGTHLDTCVMFPPPRVRRGVRLEGDRGDVEQESRDCFDRPWLPTGDDPTETQREQSLLGPDFDAHTSTRRV